MKCSKPFRDFGCGQCLPCRINRKRLWTHRLMLELYNHTAAYFLTLTFDEVHLPEDGSVSVRTAQLFLKRLRRLWPAQIRYYIVGEYGDRFDRPHYHAIIFGGPENPLAMEQLVKAAWPYGFVKVGDVTPASAAYTVSYVTKSKPLAPGDTRRPAFARMSKRPGIGTGQVLHRVSQFYSSRAGARDLSARGDVLGVLRTNGSVQPLGRYLVSKIRDSIGLSHGEPLTSSSKRHLCRLDELAALGSVTAYLAKQASTRRQHAAAARSRTALAASRKTL